MFFRMSFHLLSYAICKFALLCSFTEICNPALTCVYQQKPTPNFLEIFTSCETKPAPRNKRQIGGGGVSPSCSATENMDKYCNNFYHEGRSKL